MSDTRILLIYAHRNPDQSRVNRALLHAAAALPNVSVNDLMTRYPDWRIDVPHEQRLLLAHDVVVLQFPFYWYSTPAILKEWQDAVLTYRFAYGSGGNKLHGKKMLIATSSGGTAEVYQAGAPNHYTYSELLRPLQATANLTGMQYLPIFVTGGAMGISQAGLERAALAYQERLRSL